MRELLTRNKNINRGFKNLEIWKLAIGLYKIVVELFNKGLKISYKIRAQIEDSALSVSSNIAEGYTRRTIKENLRFYEIALSSLAENYSQLFALTAAGQMSKEEFQSYDDKIYELENKLVKMNKSLIAKLESKSDWNDDYKS